MARWMQFCSVLACFLTFGCTPPGEMQQLSREVPHALWDPGYSAGCHLVGGGKAWTEQVSDALLWRQGWPDYWSLTRLVLQHAPSADMMVIVEHVAANPRDEEAYWWGLLVQEGKQYFCYANASVPDLPTAGGGISPFAEWPWSTGDSRPQQAGPRKHVAASGAAIRAAASELLDACNNIDGRSTKIWSYDGTQTIWGDGRVIEADAWFAHVYERRGSRMARLAANFPMIDPAVVYGDTSVASLARRELPTPGELASAFWKAKDLEGKHAALILSEYEASLAIRVLLGGMLRVVRDAVELPCR